MTESQVDQQSLKQKAPAFLGTVRCVCVGWEAGRRLREESPGGLSQSVFKVPRKEVSADVPEELGPKPQRTKNEGLGLDI